MKPIKILSSVLSLTLLAGCTSVTPGNGPKGPEIITSGRTTQDGQYAEIGVKFTSWGDFVAVVSPKRWTSPVDTGGPLSWLNPMAWNDDAGRTGRILAGEVLVVGSAVAGVAVANEMRSYNSDSGSGGGSGGGIPTPPPTGPPPPSFP